MKNLFFLCLTLIFMSLFPVTELIASNTEELIMFTEDYPPLNYDQDGEITGLSVEIVKELQSRIGSEAPVKLVKWEEGYKAVHGEGQIALFTTVMTTERSKKMQWVGPIAVFENNIYAPADSKIQVNKLSDLQNNQSIGTVKDYYSQQILQEAGFTNLVEFPNEETALMKMLGGGTSLFIGNSVTLPVTAKKAGTIPHKLEKVINVSTSLAYIAFSLSTPVEIVEKWQLTLDNMKEDGTFRQIYSKWLPNEVPPEILTMMTEEYPPITFMKDGEPAGFVTDMVKEIAARKNIPANIYLTDWNNAYQMALLNPNVVLFSTERTQERNSKFHWVGPVGRNNSILYTKKGSGIKVSNLQEAREVEAIATTTDWFTEQYLVDNGFTNLISSKNPVESIEKLMNGEAQLSVFTDLTIPEIINQTKYTMNDLEPALVMDQTYFYITISQNTDPAIAEAWQKTLDEMKEDGTFEAIYHQYQPQADMTGLIKEK